MLGEHVPVRDGYVSVEQPIPGEKEKQGGGGGLKGELIW